MNCTALRASFLCSFLVLPKGRMGARMLQLPPKCWRNDSSCRKYPLLLIRRQVLARDARARTGSVKRFHFFLWKALPYLYRIKGKSSLARRSSQRSLVFNRVYCHVFCADLTSRQLPSFHVQQFSVASPAYITCMFISFVKLLPCYLKYWKSS